MLLPMSKSPESLSKGARQTILAVAFLGWFFGGMQILLTNLGMRAAAIGLMGKVGILDLAKFNELNVRAAELIGEEKAQLAAWNAIAAQWHAWFQCAFLFGAAAGGYIFGRLGDKIGRTRALGISVTWFAAFTGMAYFAQSPMQLLILRSLACLGIGGTWPNGVALVSEVWSDKARPFLASMIGMAGNLGIFAMASLAKAYPVTPDSWQWMMLINATPVLLGIFCLLAVRESPAWQSTAKPVADSGTPKDSVFRAPYLKVTLVGIVLATIPLVGGWGSANWMMPWAGEIGSQTGNEGLKADVGIARSITSIIGSLIAGIIAYRFGRRATYFATSLGALAVAQYVFWFLTPTDGSFLLWVAALGLFNGLYFGWLPFFLPELFPTKIRSTGAGVSFNFGRILTAITLFGSVYLVSAFDGDYAKIGRVTSVVFLFGMIAILFAPDTSKRDMGE